MRNRFLHFEKAHSAQPPALTGLRFSTTGLPVRADKSLLFSVDRLTGPGATERATAHLPKMFRNLYCKLERLCEETSAQPLRRRTVSIRWLETDEQLVGIEKSICAIGGYFSASATAAGVTTVAQALPKQSLRLRQLGCRVIPATQ